MQMGRARQSPCPLARGEFLCRASRSPWQFARLASKVDPETIKVHIFSDFTLRYFELIWRRLPFLVRNKGKTVQRRKKSGQVDLSRSLPQGQTDNFFFVALWFTKPTWGSWNFGSYSLDRSRLSSPGSASTWSPGPCGTTRKPESWNRASAKSRVWNSPRKRPSQSCA